MRNIGLISLILSVLIIVGCAPTANDPQNDKVENSLKELKREQENNEFLQDKERFKSEYAYRIGYNEGRIAEIKANMKKTDKDYSEKSGKIDDLEKKNRELRDRLNNPDRQTRERWEEFKKEVRNDTEALGDALKGFFKDNN